MFIEPVHFAKYCCIATCYHSNHRKQLYKTRININIIIYYSNIRARHPFILHAYIKCPKQNTSVLLGFVFSIFLLPDAPAWGFDPLPTGLAVPLPVKRVFVGETDFVLETGFPVAFFGAFEEGAAFFGGILTASEISAQKFENLAVHGLFCTYPLFLSQNFVP